MTLTRAFVEKCPGVFQREIKVEHLLDNYQHGRLQWLEMVCGMTSPISVSGLFASHGPLEFIASFRAKHRHKIGCWGTDHRGFRKPSLTHPDGKGSWEEGFLTMPEIFTKCKTQWARGAQHKLNHDRANKSIYIYI